MEDQQTLEVDDRVIVLAGRHKNNEGSVVEIASAPEKGEPDQVTVMLFTGQKLRVTVGANELRRTAPRPPTFT